jgi:hypothetical protein
MHDFSEAITDRNRFEVPTRSGRIADSADEPNDEEIMHLQADGFWGYKKGFHDVEELWRQSKQQN